MMGTLPVFLLWKNAISGQVVCSVFCGVYSPCGKGSACLGVNVSMSSVVKSVPRSSSSVSYSPLDGSKRDGLIVSEIFIVLE